MKQLLNMALVSIALLAGGGLFLTNQVAADECETVKMELVTQTVTPDNPNNIAPCTSPIPFCTEGTLAGDLEGNVHYNILSLNPISNPLPKLANVVRYLADSTWFLEDGTVQIEEVGVFDPLPGGTGRFASVQVITGGTGAFVGATGELTLAGDTIDHPPNTFFPQRLTGTICLRRSHP